MTWVLALGDIDHTRSRLVGGKAENLSRLITAGYEVPPGVCITTDAYRAFVRETGLATRIELEYNRLDLEEMRWEEIWDLALRIRNMFLTTPFPPFLENELKRGVEGVACPIAVRSSSPHEDSAESSFAGLHESFLNIVGLDDALRHIKLVWASLWSDRAILYRNELGMSTHDSSMAVVLQELVAGEVSGVAFSCSPNDGSQVMVEAVYGLNEGLVDGAVMPDRWVLDRLTGSLISHDQPERVHCTVKGPSGTEQIPLSKEQAAKPPLTEADLELVVATARSLENHFGTPQDVEWTIRNGQIIVLQTRPITTLAKKGSTAAPWSENDRRPWYLSLTRSFESLKLLRDKVEFSILPAMENDARAFNAIDLSALSREELAEHLKQRRDRHAHWVDVYWQDCIPLAHGVRLFGQVYNDVIMPDDPYEFTGLLAGAAGLDAVQRNQAITELAAMLRESATLLSAIDADEATDETKAFHSQLNAFMDEYGDQTFKTVRFFQDKPSLIKMLKEIATSQAAPAHAQTPGNVLSDDAFIGAFPENRRQMAREILDLGRASYRLRDDDNIYIAKVEAQVRKAIDEVKRRIRPGGIELPLSLSADEALEFLTRKGAQKPGAPEERVLDEPVEAQTKSVMHRSLNTSESGFVLRARQILGQPAGPGIATGPARVITEVEDLFKLKAGEILVCDSIEPTMTFVVSLVGGIVERRGGMLIHGAIIAREYGIACVTGVADATALISTGTQLTVDGYLGIVTLRDN